MENTINLPPWCHIGKYVAKREGTSVDLNMVGIITDVDESNGTVVVCWGFGGNNHAIESVDEVRPIMFRQYTFDEAKCLIGKKMVDGLGNEEVVTEVQLREDEAFINGINQWWRMIMHTDIDGRPFGVPEAQNFLTKKGKK